METKKSIVELIKLRDSKRDFSDKPIDGVTVKKITGIIEDVIGTPFGNKIELRLIRNSALSEMQKIGTYGMISGANTFIAGKVIKGRYDLEDFGYAFEKIILLLTDLGISTCWLGGSFKREEFTELMELKPDEIIPAITPVGITTGRTTLKEHLIRFIIGTKKRKSWNELFFDGNNCPLTKKESGNYEIPLEMVRLAPSAANKQPWRIIREQGRFHFFLARSPVYQVLLKKIGFDLQRLDMGIAMCHFELACNNLNLNGEWEKTENPTKFIINEKAEYIISWKTN